MLPISIVIPVFNAELYLSEAINSVLNQSNPPHEIIVINDGSTDQSLEILESYEKKIKLISRENKGVAFSVNEGIQLASQPWIGFIDADDLWMPNKLELQYRYLSENPEVQILFGQMRQFISPELPISIKDTIYCPSVPESGFIRPAMLAHQSIFKKFGLFDSNLRIGDFIDWFQKIKENGVKFECLDETVYQRRLHKNSLSSRSGAQNEFLKILKAKLDRARK